MLTKEEYVSKELNKLNLEPSKRITELKRIGHTLPFSKLNEIISEYKKDYTDDEIEISSDYGEYDSCVIVISVVVDESEEEFTKRLNRVKKRIENDYERMLGLLET